MRFHDFWVKDEFQMDIYCIAPHMLICDIWSMNTWPTYPAINQQIFCQNWGIWFSKIHCDVKTWTHCQHYWSFVWESPGDRWILGTAVSLLEASFALWVLSLPVSVFSCNQATLWMVQSVCPSVHPSQLFLLCSHHRITMKFSLVITIDRNEVHAKG